MITMPQTSILLTPENAIIIAFLVTIAYGLAWLLGEVFTDGH